MLDMKRPAGLATAGRDTAIDTTDNRLNSQPKNKPQAIAFALHYGGAHSALALVMPDDHWPGMWRVHWPDGALSDMVNLTRARDAAAAIAERGPPRRNPLCLRWQIKPVRDGVGSPPIAPLARP